MSPFTPSRIVALSLASFGLVTWMLMAYARAVQPLDKLNFDAMHFDLE